MLSHFHPRLSSSTTTTTTTTSSTTSTPISQSRRHSVSSTLSRSSTLFQTPPTANSTSPVQSTLKKIWREIKQHAAEHHRSVNAVYQAQYGAVAGVNGGSRRGAEMYRGLLVVEGKGL